MLTYDTIKTIKYSDHRPVVGTFLVNCENKKNENNNIKLPKENKIDLIYAD